MRLEPGVGWGEAKLGTTRRELVKAFGQPSNTTDDEEHSISTWESQGLRVAFSLETKKAEWIELRPPAQVSDLTFDLSEDEVLDVQGEAIETRRNDDRVELEFNGLTAHLAGDRVERLVISALRELRDNEKKITNPELEAAIVASPEDRAPVLVFADWLTQEGHARGALITEHASGATIDDRPDLELLGPGLGPLGDMLTHRAWRLGFLEKVTVASNFDRSPNHDGKLEDVTVSEVLHMLLDGSLAGRFLRELTLGISTFESNDYGAEMLVIGERPRPLLRSLFIGDFQREETELNWSNLGDAGVMWKALPNLREVTLRSGTMQLGELVLPELRSFTTLTGGLQKPELASIARAHWPKLERLDLQIGSDRYGSDCALEDFAPLLEGKGIPPSVKHLAFANSELADGLVPMLAESRVLEQLEKLDLSRGTFGQEGAEAMIAAKDRFAHLKLIDLSESWLSPEMEKRVREAFPQAVTFEQQWDERYPADRYIAAGE